MMLCSKLHCQKFSKLKLFSYKIYPLHHSGVVRIVMIKRDVLLTLLAISWGREIASTQEGSYVRLINSCVTQL